MSNRKNTITIDVQFEGLSENYLIKTVAKKISKDNTVKFTFFFKKANLEIADATFQLVEFTEEAVYKITKHLLEEYLKNVVANTKQLADIFLSNN